MRSRQSGALAGVLSAALLLGGCVIGDVDRGGSPGTAPGTGATSGTPRPGGSGDGDPGDPGDPGGIEVPEDAGRVGVALLDDGEVRTGGSMAGMADAAWSTIKVPLAIAALTADGADGVGLSGEVTRAITVSDNDAADALWASLGEPGDAAAAVQDVLREGGDTGTVVPAEPRRAEFSTYGQTTWTLPDQVTFASKLRCIAGSGPVVEAMGQVVAGQDYGLGRLDGAVFKGGWGPGENGGYLVRQFGLIPAADGTSVPVAVAATAPDGTYESAQSVLDGVADKLGKTIAGAHGVDAAGDC